jgi:arsenite-transporting ATPase
MSFPDVARWWLERVFPQQGRILDAARPVARALLDIHLPGAEVLDDVHRLVRNLIAMNEILRDTERVSIRLVMTPDRMVIDEARRTFTYLNLYGFLTDAVVVNRVFPEDVGPYFAAWRARQRAELDAVRDAFGPLPVLCAPFFDEEVVGPGPVDRLGDALFADVCPSGVLHTTLSEELTVSRDAATLRLDLPFAHKDGISVKKIGLELVLRVDGHKRTVLLPPVLSDYRPTGASFADGALEVCFTRPQVGAPAPT